MRNESTLVEARIFFSQSCVMQAGMEIEDGA